MPKLVKKDLTPEEFESHVQKENSKLAKNKKGDVEMTKQVESAKNDLVDRGSVAEGSTSARTGGFATFARVIYRTPAIFVVLLPAICLVVGFLGLMNYEVEKSVNEIWTLSSGSYYEDNKYKDSVYTGNDGSSLLAVAVPRDGGNIMSSAHITTLADRFSITQETTVTHEGETFTFDDMCLNVISPYVYPCYRVNSLDCFKEGDYDWDDLAAKTWRASVQAGGIAVQEATAANTLMATTVCATSCLDTGTTLKTAWATDATCLACMETYVAADAADQVVSLSLAAIRSSVIDASIAATTLSNINGVIATRVGAATAGDGGCFTGGSEGSHCTAAGDYGTVSACTTCVDTVYAAMNSFQKGEAFYPTMNAAAAVAEICVNDADNACRDADGDTYLKDATSTTVNGYDEATITALGIDKVVNYIGIALRGGTDGCSAVAPLGTNVADQDCTYDANFAFMADTACATCFGTYYAGMDATEQAARTGFYDGVKAHVPGITTDAAAQAWLEGAATSITFSTASKQLVATGFCQANAGDTNYGPCDMSTSAWETDATCMACFNGFLDGDEATQNKYHVYAALRSSFVDSGVATAKKEAIYTAFATAACPTQCTVVGSYTDSITAGTWANMTECKECYMAAYAAASPATLDATYYAAISGQTGFAAGYCPTQNAGGTTGGGGVLAECRDSNVDTVVKTKAETTVNGYNTATIDSILSGLVWDSVKSLTPYTYQTNRAGAPRPVATGATDEYILNAASDTCYTWDGGQGYPATGKPVTFGGTKPGVTEVSIDAPFTIVEAFQVIYRFIHPADIVKRVAMANRPGGAKVIKEKDAEEILYKMKEAFEKEYVRGWEDKNDGDIQFSGFSDDVGARGSFGRTLETFTTQSAPLSVLSYLALLLLSAVLLASIRNPVRSQATLGFFGALMVMLAFMGALGCTILNGVKLNVIQTWTLPFLMVGIGVDDMFILALAANEATARLGRADEDAFVEAFVEVTTPVTLTSLVNAAMFVVMLFSDIPAVYLTAQTALFSIVLMYFTVITAFSAAVAIDFRRQTMNRLDFLVCIESSDTNAITNVSEKKNPLWERAYKPFVSSLPGHIFILLASLLLVAAGGYGLTTINLGLGLAEFFPEGSVGALYASNQEEFFPVWPGAMNWGELDYHTSEVQLDMLKQFEDVVGNKRVTELDSNYVWTAAVAEWSMPESYGLGACDESNVLTSGKCGPVLSATCTGSWVENSEGLKLKAAGGVCQEGTWVAGIDASAVADTTKSYCPVLALTEAEFITCLGLAFSTSYLAPLGVGLEFETGTTTPETPIKYSQASGSSLYIFDLFTGEDYVEAIEDTREFCDNSDTQHCWMSGIPYDYWEQYLTIEMWMLRLCGIVCAISFFAATFFFWANFGQLAPAATGGLVVTLTSAATLLTVTGVSSMADVNLCGLSAMSCIMSAGFAVEYSVHVVHRFMEAPADMTPQDRALKAMDGLFLPTSMAFLTSGVGICFLMASTFKFVHVYFFTPLITVLFVTYFFGVFTLPVLFARIGHLSGFSVKAAEGAEEDDAAGNGIAI